MVFKKIDDNRFWWSEIYILKEPFKVVVEPEMEVGAQIEEFFHGTIDKKWGDNGT